MQVPPAAAPPCVSPPAFPGAGVWVSSHLQPGHPASGFHTNISSRRGHCPIRHAARVQVCRDIFSRPPRFLSVSRFILAETKQFAWLRFLSQTGFWLISQGQGVKEFLERIPRTQMLSAAAAEMKCGGSYSGPTGVSRQAVWTT